MDSRPPFSSFSSYEEFCQYYWYREELIQICKSIGARHTGSKQELLNVIEEWFKGNLLLPVSLPKNKGKYQEEITLDTGILECDFTFSQRMRLFFSEITGQTPFKFTADMVATVKKVKEEQDSSFTIRNLLDVYYGREVYAKFDNSSCQWNQFVKDFCRDVNSEKYHPKMKAAALLWSFVRKSKEEKVYKSSLLERYYEELKKYKI